MLFALLALPALAVGLPSQNNMLQLPLTRRAFYEGDDVIDLDRLAKSVSSLRSKYGYKSSGVPELGRRASQADIDIVDQVRVLMGWWYLGMKTYRTFEGP